MPTKLPPGMTLAPKQQEDSSRVKLPAGMKLDPAVDRFLKTPKSDTGETKEPGLNEVWSSMTKEEKDSAFNNLPASDQVKLMDQLKQFGHATGFSAQPEFGPETMTHVLAGEPMKDPWIRQKATNLIYNTAHWLPAIGGTVGAYGGAAAGAAITKTPQGAYAGKLLGSGVGGAGGELMRQMINHEMGWEDQPLTAGDRAWMATKEGAGQMASEMIAAKIGKFIRPTMAKSIAKLYYAGGLDYGDRRLEGAVERVADDFSRVEKARVGKATTVGDFIDVLNETKDKIGHEVDSAMMQPITQNGRQVMLGVAHADTTGIQTEIRNLLTSSPSMIREAQINPTGESAAYLKRVEAEALKYQKGVWTYRELCDKRIRLNEDLAAMYSLPKGEQRAYLVAHPDLLIKKKEADAIRNITYRNMDLASGRPVGFTEELQTKRGILMDLSNQADQHLRNLMTASRQESGAPLSEKMNVSTFGTTTGRPGVSVHRLHRLVHQATPEQYGNTQVARAFRHTAGTKIGAGLGSQHGVEVMAMPLRWMFGPPSSHSEEIENQKQEAEEDDNWTPPVQPQAQPLPQVTKEAQARNPSVQPKQYARVAKNKSGHKIGSDDGTHWFDIETGKPVQ